jgi:hypothetical protein
MNNLEEFKKVPPLNPYLFGLRAIWGRLRWDLSLESFVSRAKLNQLRNSFFGEKCIVVCNGPSLNSTNLESIQEAGIYSFGLNKINLIFDKRDFKPSAIVAVNKLVIEQNQIFFNSTEIPLFIDSTCRSIIKSRQKTVFLHSSMEPCFAKNCSLSIQQGYTVTFVAMQLAFHMGFRTLGLVGCDHNYSFKGKENSMDVSGEIDVNHFDPKYFADGNKWELPDLPACEYYYKMAGRAFSLAGGNIVNCTTEGLLEIFQRKSLEDFLSE